MQILKTTLFLGLMGPIAAMSLADDQATWTEEVRATELAFAAMAAETGLKEAFLAFADDNAVINRGEKIHKGKEAIAAWFDAQTMKDVSLVWEPDFIAVSDDGSLAYTYGPFTFKGRNAKGDPFDVSGLFHTVWKHQSDGSWKFVYD